MTRALLRENGFQSGGYQGVGVVGHEGFIVHEYPNQVFVEVFYITKKRLPEDIQKEDAMLRECLPDIRKSFPGHRFTVELVEDSGLPGSHSRRGRGTRKCVRIMPKAV